MFKRIAKKLEIGTGKKMSEVFTVVSIISAG